MDALATLAICALVLAGAAALSGKALRRWRAPVAARAAASEIRGLRSMAIARAANQGLRFERDPVLGWTVTELEDGDGDGIRTEDVRRGVDRVRGGPHALQRRWGLQPGYARSLRSLRSPPPDSSPLGSLEDPVRLGSRDIASSSPRGTITPGTIYLSDGEQRQFAVVVAGSTGRVRVWEYLLERQEWVLR